MKKEIVPNELEFLLRFPAVMNVTSPVDFLNNLCWGGIKVSSKLDLVALSRENHKDLRTNKLRPLGISRRWLNIFRERKCKYRRTLSILLARRF